jgi:uncharacterized protein YacL
MKKVLFIAIVSLMSITSCKKDYVCVCTTTQNGEITSTKEKSIKDREKKAKEECDSEDNKTTTSTPFIDGSIETVVDCEFK